jgi:hypothetical protein
VPLRPGELRERRITEPAHFPLYFVRSFLKFPNKFLQPSL